jgi:hypothetical protein
LSQAAQGTDYNKSTSGMSRSQKGNDLIEIVQ